MFHPGREVVGPEQARRSFRRRIERRDELAEAFDEFLKLDHRREKGTVGMEGRARKALIFGMVQQGIVFSGVDSEIARTGGARLSSASGGG